MLFFALQRILCCVCVTVGWSCWLRNRKISSFRIKKFAAVGSSQHEKVSFVGYSKQNHKGEGLHIPTAVWVGFYVTQKGRMHPSHLCSCAVTVSTLSPAWWILLQSLWELNHIFTWSADSLKLSSCICKQIFPSHVVNLILACVLKNPPVSWVFLWRQSGPPLLA